MSAEEVVSTILILAIVGLIGAGGWRTFAKAGKPGWAFLVPVYNWYVITQIGGLSGAWLFGMFVPYANMFINPYIHYKLAQRFSCGPGMTLALLVGIGWPILGFGNFECLPDSTESDQK